jgi:hypothetical protein
MGLIPQASTTAEAAEASTPPRKRPLHDFAYRGSPSKWDSRSTYSSPRPFLGRPVNPQAAVTACTSHNTLTTIGQSRGELVASCKPITLENQEPPEPDQALQSRSQCCLCAKDATACTRHEEDISLHKSASEVPMNLSPCLAATAQIMEDHSNVPRCSDTRSPRDVEPALLDPLCNLKGADIHDARPLNMREQLDQRLADAQSLSSPSRESWPEDAKQERVRSPLQRRLSAQLRSAQREGMQGGSMQRRCVMPIVAATSQCRSAHISVRFISLQTGRDGIKAALVAAARAPGQVEMLALIDKEPI